MLLWLFVVIPSVLGQAGFGRSYLRNSRLCHQWTCINSNLGFSDALPPATQAKEVLSRLLPQGAWQDAVGRVVDSCYGARARRYTNTCPGQALMHCMVDQLIENCPEESQRKNDACAPVSSLAGMKNMFTQSRYDNLEANLPVDIRPEWFVKNYFNVKCCDIPEILNKSVIEVCGFSSFLNYYTHPLTKRDPNQPKMDTKPSITLHSNNGDSLRIFDFNHFEPTSTDPLDCCDMSDFIQPTWRSECQFNLTWGGHKRLVFPNKTEVTTPAPTTTPSTADLPKDLMLLPQSCENETCLFSKLNIIKDGSVDLDAFSKMLDNLTNSHPTWTKAKARVVTKCLSRKVRDYDGDCEINKILSCTLDILTENCPYTKKSNVCKHGNRRSGCQISSSKYRPKNRREICLLPELIHTDHLSECGLESLYRAEHVVDNPKPRKHRWMSSGYICKDTTAASTCIMNKMGILNRYNFLDYFKMKDRIRSFTSDKAEWSALLDIYMSAFINIPMYREHCSSQKKLLNVIDSILMTCPVSKRKNTPQCNKIFMEMSTTTPLDNQQYSEAKLGQILKHYHHIYMPPPPVFKYRRIHKNHKKPLFNYGFLDSKDAPKVNIIDVKPTKPFSTIVPSTTVPTINTKVPKYTINTAPLMPKDSKPLVILPVYLRPPYKDGAFRSTNPFWLHEQIAKAHSTPVPVMRSQGPTITPLFPIYTDVLPERPIDMIRN